MRALTWPTHCSVNFLRLFLSELLLAVADGLADRDHGLLEQLLLEILVVELGLEVDGVLCKLVLGRQTLGLGGGFAGGFDLF